VGWREADWAELDEGERWRCLAGVPRARAAAAPRRSAG